MQRTGFPPYSLRTLTEVTRKTNPHRNSIWFRKQKLSTTIIIFYFTKMNVRFLTHSVATFFRNVNSPHPYTEIITIHFDYIVFKLSFVKYA